MEQWIGSVHSKMAWRTHFFLFGVYRVLEKSYSYTHPLAKIRRLRQSRLSPDDDIKLVKRAPSPSPFSIPPFPITRHRRQSLPPCLSSDEAGRSSRISWSLFFMSKKPNGEGYWNMCLFRWVFLSKKGSSTGVERWCSASILCRANEGLHSWASMSRTRTGHAVSENTLLNAYAQINPTESIHFIQYTSW